MKVYICMFEKEIHFVTLSMERMKEVIDNWLDGSIEDCPLSESEKDKTLYEETDAVDFIYRNQLIFAISPQ